MLTGFEVFDILLMTAYLGFLFKDVFVPPSGHYEPLAKRKSFSGFWFACKVIAPPIILHELAHKFVAVGFGLSATFHAFYADPTTLVLGGIAFLAKLANFGFFLIVPGFVSIAGSATPLENFLIAFAGPGVHLALWAGSWLWLRRKGLSRTQALILAFTSRINMFLFVFNMIPIPPFDGFQVFKNLFQLF